MSFKKPRGSFSTDKFIALATCAVKGYNLYKVIMSHVHEREIEANHLTAISKFMHVSDFFKIGVYNHKTVYIPRSVHDSRTYYYYYCQLLAALLVSGVHLLVGPTTFCSSASCHKVKQLCRKLWHFLVLNIVLKQLLSLALSRLTIGKQTG